MNVTNLVPGFLLRLETGCESIKIPIFKALIRFIYKILCMKENSALYQCLIMLKLNKNNDKRYNWMLQVKNLFTTHGLQCEFDKLTKEYLHENRKEIVAKFCQATVQSDIIEMNNSERFPYFKSIKTHVTQSEFLKSNLTFSEMRLIQQLRTNVPRIRVKDKIIELNGIWEVWKNKDKSKYCVSCGFNKTEDIYHVMFECNSFINARNKYLHKYIHSNTNKDNYIVIIFKDANEKDYKNICNFWISVGELKGDK